MNVAKLECVDCGLTPISCTCIGDYVRYVVIRQECRRLKMNGVHCWHYNAENEMFCCDCGELMSDDL
jgi:hypothetical protein